MIRQHDKSSVDANTMHLLKWHKVRDDRVIRADLEQQLSNINQKFEAWKNDDREAYVRATQDPDRV